MITWTSAVCILISYLLGSIPTAVWIGQHFYGIDVREHGSGNAGATNTFRTLGKKAGIPVLLFDVFKGWAAVQLAYLSSHEPGSSGFVDLQLVFGIAALLGHIFPVYVGFRGGKGVATLLGVVIAVHPLASLICIGVFLLVWLLTAYVSLASMLAALTFPFLVILIFHVTVTSLILFSISIAILVIVTHQKNIERLLRREESKVSILKRGGNKE